MDKQITLLEGQTSNIVVKPTFEGVAAGNQVDISQTLTDAAILPLITAPVEISDDNTTVTVPVIAGAATDITGNLVFKYKGNDSEVENIGISTKEIGITVNPAQLAVDGAVTPSTFKWVPGEELDITVKYKNGDQPILANNDSLNVGVASGSELELVSRSATGLVLKINDDADASTVPTVAQQFIAKYFSGEVDSTLTFVGKPALTITSTPVSTKKGDAAIFPTIVVKDGDTDVSTDVTNIVPVPNDFFTFDDTGAFTVVKDEATEVTETITYNFDYTKDGFTWSYSVDVAVTIAAATVAMTLSDVSTPLTMDLWAKQTLSYKVMQGETDVTADVTAVTVTNADDIKDKFEVTQDGIATTFQSVSSSSTETVTATANVTITVTIDGTATDLTTTVDLVTNINDGSISTNRFNVEMAE